MIFQSAIRLERGGVAGGVYFTGVFTDWFSISFTVLIGRDSNFGSKVYCCASLGMVLG